MSKYMQKKLDFKRIKQKKIRPEVNPLLTFSAASLSGLQVGQFVTLLLFALLLNRVYFVMQILY